MGTGAGERPGFWQIGGETPGPAPDPRKSGMARGTGMGIEGSVSWVEAFFWNLKAYLSIIMIKQPLTTHDLIHWHP